MNSATEPKIPWGAKQASLLWITAFFLIVFAAFFTIRILRLDELSAIVMGELVAIIPIIIYLKLRNIPISYLGFRRSSLPKVLCISLLLGFVALVLSAVWGLSLTILIPGYAEYLKTIPSVVPKSGEDLGKWLIVILVFIGPMEEILSRGFVQRGMENRFGNKGGLIIASLLFGVIHFEPAAAANAFIIGLFIGYVYQKTKYNLWIPIGIHVVFDWVAVIMRFFLTV